MCSVSESRRLHPPNAGNLPAAKPAAAFAFVGSARAAPWNYSARSLSLHAAGTLSFHSPGPTNAQVAVVALAFLLLWCLFGVLFLLRGLRLAKTRSTDPVTKAHDRFGAITFILLGVVFVSLTAYGLVRVMITLVGSSFVP